MRVIHIRFLEECMQMKPPEKCCPLLSSALSYLFCKDLLMKVRRLNQFSAFVYSANFVCNVSILFTYVINVFFSLYQFKVPNVQRLHLNYECLDFFFHFLQQSTLCSTLISRLPILKNIHIFTFMNITFMHKSLILQSILADKLSV